jgi:hypothetical protein
MLSLIVSLHSDPVAYLFLMSKRHLKLAFAKSNSSHHLPQICSAHSLPIPVDDSSIIPVAQNRKP